MGLFDLRAGVMTVTQNSRPFIAADSLYSWGAFYYAALFKLLVSERAKVEKNIQRKKISLPAVVGQQGL